MASAPPAETDAVAPGDRQADRDNASVLVRLNDIPLEVIGPNGRPSVRCCNPVQYPAQATVKISCELPGRRLLLVLGHQRCLGCKSSEPDRVNDEDTKRFAG